MQALLIAAFLLAAPLAAIPAQGEAAPDFTFNRAWNQKLEATSLSGLRGRPVMVEFWATWCPPCVKGIPHLNELHDTFAPRGLAIVAVTNEDAGLVEPFISRHAMRYPVVQSAKAGQAFGVQSIPHAFLLDQAGTVVWQGHPGDVTHEMMGEFMAGRSLPQTASGPLDFITSPANRWPLLLILAAIVAAAVLVWPRRKAA